MEPVIGGRGDGGPRGIPSKRPVPPIALALGVVVVGVLAVGLARSRTTEGTDEAAGYLTIQNDGGADQLIAADADAAGQVTIHRTVAVGNVERMEPQAGVRVPKGITRLEPGGGHLMLEQLDEALVPGATVTLTLSFSRFGPVVVRATVHSYSEIAASLERSAP